MSRLRAVRAPLIGLLGLATLLISAGVVANLVSAGGGLTTQDLTQGINAESLAATLAGEGVSISNVHYAGAGTAAGRFSGGSGIIGFEAGILLSTGSIAGVIGPNTSDDLSHEQLTAGDSDLAALSGTNTFDAAVLEFDFVPSGSSVQFRYVFASEEYNEFVHQPFNDVFGFFINGVNCAGVDGLGISVNTVNNGNPFDTDPREHASLYRNNDMQDGGGATNTQMDGLTQVLTCLASVNAGVANHIKLGIADSADGRADANVFLEAAGFIVAPTQTATSPATSTATPSASPTRTPTASPTATPSSTTVPSITPARTPTRTPVATSTRTRVPTNTPTATATTPRTRTPTRTVPPPTVTLVPTFTPTPTFTRVPAATNTPPIVIVVLPTETLPPTNTPTPTSTDTATPTSSPSPTATATRESGVLAAVQESPEPVVPRTSGSILGVDNVSKDPRVIGTNFILAIILLVLLFFSSTLFNDTISEHRVQFQAFFHRLTRPLRIIRREFSIFTQVGPWLPWLERAVGPVLVLSVSGLIYSLGDPGFGWNSSTLLLFSSLMAAMGILTYIYEGGEALITTHRFQVPAAVRLFPVALLIAGGFSLFARLVDFEAPIMYGFVASATVLVVANLDHRQSALAVFLPGVVLLGVAVGAWLLLDPLREVSQDSSAWWAHLPSETAALVFAGGIEGLLFTMIPIQFTDGSKVFKWNRLLWLLMFAIPAFFFVWVIVNPQAEAFDTLLEDRVIVVLSMVGAYVAVAVGTWAFFFIRREGDGHDETRPRPPEPGHPHDYRPLWSPLEKGAADAQRWTPPRVTLYRSNWES